MQSFKASVLRQLASSGLSLPFFRLKGEHIRVLSLQGPYHCFQTILDLVDKAEERISISSLYLGTGELEQELLRRIDQRMEQKPQVPHLSFLSLSMQHMLPSLFFSLKSWM